MLSLVEDLPDTQIRIFSGLNPGDVRRALFLAVAGDGVNEDEWPNGSTNGAAGDGSSNARGGCQVLGTVIKAKASSDGDVSAS